MIDSKLILLKELLPYFNVSMFLKGIPLIRELVVQNNGDDSYSNLQMRIISDQPLYDCKSGDYRTNEVEKRDMEDIAPEEIMLAILETLNQHLSIEEGELLRYIAKVFGFAKVGKQIEFLLQYALSLLEKQGRLRKDGGRVFLVK